MESDRMDHDHAEPRVEGDGPGYETRDANPRSLMRFGFVLFAFLALTIIGMLAVYRVVFVPDKVPEGAWVIPSQSPDDIYHVLRTLRESEKERLTTYGWVDRKAGIVRIPIDRAIDLVAQRGVPKGKGPRTEAELNSYAGRPAQAADSKPKETDSKAKEKETKK
jgi:hypothetical protein